MVEARRAALALNRTWSRWSWLPDGRGLEDWLAWLEGRLVHARLHWDGGGHHHGHRRT